MVFFAVSLFISWLVLPIYQFVVSKESDFLFEHEVENPIKPNYIIILTEIKKTKGGESITRILEILLYLGLFYKRLHFTEPYRFMNVKSSSQFVNLEA